MKNFFILLFVAFINFNFYGQMSVGINNRLLDFNLRALRDNGGDLIDLSTVQGSPYLNANFENGQILMVNKDELFDMLLRYNIYSDEVEAKSETDENLSSVLKEKDIQCKLSGQVFSFDSNLGYVVMLEEGKNNLVLKYKSIYKEAEPGKTPMHQNIPAKFVTKKLYFLKMNNVYTEIPSSLNGLYKLFSEQEESLKSFIKENKLKYSKEEDLVKMIHFLNKL